ncbi:MAG: HK97 family phage prohead protease [Acidobacteriia bacterium]|nr:HK97 family phage prohead protease [Terriglobia bacterium]
MATIEKRSCELRAAQGEEGVLVGRAVSYNRVSTNSVSPGVRERIMPGAFAASLAGGADVRATFQHDPAKTLGRTSAGTLKLTDGPDGLDVRITLDKGNSDHMNLWRSVARRDYSEMSFAFGCENESYDEGTDEQGHACQIRTVRKAKLIDVAVVANPFYTADMTSVSARSAGAAPTGREALDAIVEEHRRAAALAAGAPAVPTESRNPHLRNPHLRYAENPTVAVVENTDEYRRAKATRLGEQINRAAPETLRERAERLGREISQETDAWYSMRWDAKEDALDELDDLLAEEYSEGRFRAIDVAPITDAPGSTGIARSSQGDEPALLRGSVVYRSLNSEKEDFGMDDWIEEEPDDDEQERSAKRGPTKRSLRLCGNMRLCSPSVTKWQASERALHAAAEWTLRQQHLESELRMAVAAGNHSAIARINRLRVGK